MDQGTHLQFLRSIGSLNALSTFYVCFLFPLVTFLLFLLLCIWRAKALLKEKVLSCEKRMKKRRHRVFNLSCRTFYDGALCTCLFLEGKNLNMLQRNYIQSVTHCILCCSSVRSYLRIFHVQKRRTLCKYATL